MGTVKISQYAANKQTNKISIIVIYVRSVERLWRALTSETQGEEESGNLPQMQAFTEPARRECWVQEGKRL